MLRRRRGGGERKAQRTDQAKADDRSDADA
jgi:hypothetical protein